MKLIIEIEQEKDGRWAAEVTILPRTKSYGQTRLEAVAGALAFLEEVEAVFLQHPELLQNLIDKSKEE